MLVFPKQPAPPTEVSPKLLCLNISHSELHVFGLTNDLGFVSSKENVKLYGQNLLSSLSSNLFKIYWKGELS